MREHLTSAGLYRFLSKASKSLPLLKPQRIDVSRQTRQEITNLQLKGTYPHLVVFEHGRGTYMARVR